MTDWAEFTGQFIATDDVRIHARVGGFLTEVRFTDGQRVQQGDLLFVIDARPFEIALASARAKLDQAMAARVFAERQLERAGHLSQSDAVAKSTFDQRTLEMRTAAAGVDAARAAVREAELNLEFTRVVAPVSGRIGTHEVTIGNLITAGSGSAFGTLLRVRPRTSYWIAELSHHQAN